MKGLIRQCLYTFFLCFLSLAPAYSGCPFLDFDKDFRGLAEYRGELGGLQIQMTLELRGMEARALYFYKMYKVDIEVKGTIAADRTFEFIEYDTRGRAVAKFVGSFPEYDPRTTFARNAKLGCEVMVGNWVDLTKDGRELPLYLASFAYFGGSLDRRFGGLTDGGVSNEQIFKLVETFLDALKNDKRQKVASLAHYPFIAQVDGKNRKISTAREFLALYDKIIDRQYKKQVELADVNPRHLGFMTRGFLEIAHMAYVGPDLKIWVMGGYEDWP